MKAEVQPLSIILITLVVIAGSVYIAHTAGKLGPPQAEQVQQGLPSLSIEQVTSLGEVIVRNLGTAPAYVDTLYIRDSSGERLLHVKTLTPPLEVPPGEVRRVYLPDIPLEKGTPITVSVSGKTGASISTPARYYPPYGGWLALADLRQATGLSANVKRILLSIGMLSASEYVAAGYYEESGLTQQRLAQLIVFHATGAPAASVYNLGVNSNQYTIQAASAAWSVGGQALVSVHATDGSGNRHVLLASFPLPLSSGQTASSIEPYLGSTPGGAERDRITRILPLNKTHALVLGSLNNTDGGRHDAVVLMATPGGGSVSIDYILALGYWDANGSPADGEVAVDAVVEGNLLYILGHGGVTEPANQGNAAFLLVFNTSSNTLHNAVVIGSPPTNNVTAVDLLKAGDLYVLMRLQKDTSSYDTLIARLDPQSLQPKWVRAIDYTVNENPLALALIYDGLRVLIDSGASSLILANLDPRTGEVLWAHEASPTPKSVGDTYRFQTALLSGYRIVGVAGYYVFSLGVQVTTAVLLGEVNTETPGRIEMPGGIQWVYTPVSAVSTTFADIRQATGSFTPSLTGGYTPGDSITLS